MGRVLAEPIQPPLSCRIRAVCAGPVTALAAVLALPSCGSAERSGVVRGAGGFPYVPTPVAGEPAARATTDQRLRRLSVRELGNVYAELLGGQQLPLVRSFLPDPRAEGFDNDAVALGVSDSTAEELLTAAERVGLALVAPGALERHAPCPPAEDPRGCAGTFADRAVLTAWGRPASAQERERLLAVFDTGVAAAAGAGAYAGGISLIAEAVLTSPHFVYRFELGDRAPAGATEVQLSGPEIASALSFLLRGARPDGPLLQLALSGRLADPEVRAAEAGRLLQAPAGRSQLALFIRSWLGLLDVGMTNKDVGLYPQFLPVVRQAMDRELDQFLDHVLASKQGRLDEVLTADYGFPSPALAPIYGADTLAPIGEFTLVPLASHRRGLLTSPGFLSAHALINQTNPVERGLMVRRRLLCQDVPPPPPDVLAQPPGGGNELTTRAKYEAHRSDPRCAGCHRLIDALGFGFENFDAIGRHRRKEGAHLVDATGEVVGTDVDGPFNGAAELSAKLINSAQFRRCFVEQLVRFVEGREIQADDAGEIAFLAHQLEQADHRMGDLVVALVSRPGFVLRRRAVEVAP